MLSPSDSGLPRLNMAGHTVTLLSGRHKGMTGTVLNPEVAPFDRLEIKPGWPPGWFFDVELDTLASHTPDDCARCRVNARLAATW